MGRRAISCSIYIPIDQKTNITEVLRTYDSVHMNLYYSFICIFLSGIFLIVIISSWSHALLPLCANLFYKYWSLFLIGCCNHCVLLIGDCFLCFLCPFSWRPRLGVHLDCHLLSSGMWLNCFSFRIVWVLFFLNTLLKWTIKFWSNLLASEHKSLFYVHVVW